MGVPPGPPPEEPPPPADPDLPPAFGPTTTTTTVRGSTSTTTRASTTTTAAATTTTTSTLPPGCAAEPSAASVRCRLDALRAAVTADASSYRQRKSLLALLGAATKAFDDAAARSSTDRKRKRLLNAVAKKLNAAARPAKIRTVPAGVHDEVQRVVGPLVADVRGLHA